MAKKRRGKLLPRRSRHQKEEFSAFSDEQQDRLFKGDERRSREPDRKKPEP